MKIYGIISFGFLLIFQTACSSSQPKQPSKLTLNSVFEIGLGTFNQAEALGRFGEPDKKVNLPNAPALEAWLYFEHPSHQTKLSLIFEKTSGVLQRKTWIVGAHEPEDNLETAKARFPTAHFENHHAKQTNPHFIADEIIFDDKQLGLTMVYREAVKEVESISWTDSKLRSLAGSVEKANPPVK